ncbi:MAG: ABC transporter substrate-binding protein [Proteobacteria bacterium]|nr:ABC transporter substrate-binding protein [Pseudomonadota bacterium]
MRKINFFTGLLLSILAAGVWLGTAVLPVAAAPSGAPAELKVAFVDFLSGPAAIFGTSGRYATEWLVDKWNKEGGIQGVPVKLVILDENGGPAKMVTEFRRLVMEEKVNAVLGYTSSANSLAIAPVAEELKTLTLIHVAGTNRLTEDHKLHYTFRTSNHQAADSVLLARYVLKLKPNLKSIAGVNEDYAWGRDSWDAFTGAIKTLKPGVQVKAELWTKFQAGEYSAEISKLLAARADVVHSSFWAGGLVTFIKQANARGLMKQNSVALSTGAQVLQFVGKDMPDGIIVCPRATGAYFLDPDPAKDPMQKEFVDGYRPKVGRYPDYVSYRAYQAAAGMKVAYEKAIAQAGRWPTTEEVIKALEGLTWKAPGGDIHMRAEDHQAIHDGLVGITKMSKKHGFALMEKRDRFAGEQIMPPAGMKTPDWVKTLKK